MARILSEIKIKDIMTTKITAAQENDRVIDVAQVMMDKDFNGIPVIDDARRLIGMVGMKELLNNKGLYLPTIVSLVNNLKVSYSKDIPQVAKKIKHLKDLKVSSVMNRNPFYLTDNISLEKTAEAFLIHHEDIFPVVDHHQTLVGVISKYDILKAVTHPLKAVKIDQGMTIEAEPWNIVEDINKNFVVVSKTRAMFWYMALGVFLLLGIIVALATILRIRLA